MGASIWWPNKDIQADEPDSQRIAITVPETVVDVSNGRPRKRTVHGDGTITYARCVDNPIVLFQGLRVDTAFYEYEGQVNHRTSHHYSMCFHNFNGKKGGEYEKWFSTSAVG